MPRLILLNGPPACGKSTLARRYVDGHPLALDLDIDVVRGLLGRWPEHAREAGLLARSIALAAARTHLTGGHDVVVPQLLARPAFIDQAGALARELGCAFHEIALVDTKENLRRRYIERAAARNRTTFDEAARTLAEQGQLTGLDEIHDRLTTLLGTRPDTRTIRIREGEVAGAYRDLLEILTGPSS
ncbi:AAA family ATPase [Actinoplanes sp. Pm04-4]|uniref:AAA family ATPase n=1 Tax=Paractinoplanes pyxinae TaxID=2997416 RepID=A0ABT4B8M4_9ACTN|nr:AAA family ATPase [Actinoplanes pyxinae]MCY1142801.1 AAA family ATPase [Actinoplanes pyxinae]